MVLALHFNVLIKECMCAANQTLNPNKTQYLIGAPARCAVGMYADASGAAQTFQYDTAALQQLGASISPLAPQPGAVGALLTWTQG